MGYARTKPRRLAEKLLHIRTALGLSQPMMLRTLDVERQTNHTMISKYELDKSEPPLDILLQYARAAGVHLENLVDDELDLPAKLPGNVRYQGTTRKRL